MKKGKLFKNINVKSNMFTYLCIAFVFAILQGLKSAGALSNMFASLLVPMCVYACMAVSLNFTVGILGELSLGHAGFMALGAYTSATFTKILSFYCPNLNSIVRFIFAILLGSIVAFIFGFLIGIPVLRLKGDYLAIVTLAFGEIIKNILQVFCLAADDKGLHFNTLSVADMDLTENNMTIIDGAMGIKQIPRDATFLAGILLLLITLIVVLNIINSRDGRAIMAIRDNTIAAESVGLNITFYKILAFAISAFFAGAAGAVYAHTYSSIQSGTFDYNLSILILVYVVLGGIGNLKGSIISAAILTLLPELLRGLNMYRMLIYAIVLIVIMLFNWAPSWIMKREVIKAYISKKFAKKSKEGK